MLSCPEDSVTGIDDDNPSSSFGEQADEDDNFSDLLSASQVDTIFTDVGGSMNDNLFGTTGSFGTKLSAILKLSLMRTISVTLKRKQPRNPQICLISNVLFIRPFTTAFRILKHTKLTTTPLMGDSSVVFAQKIMPQSICIANTFPKDISA